MVCAGTGRADRWRASFPAAPVDGVPAQPSRPARIWRRRQRANGRRPGRQLARWPPRAPALAALFSPAGGTARDVFQGGSWQRLAFSPHLGGPSCRTGAGGPIAVAGRRTPDCAGPRPARLYGGGAGSYSARFASELAALSARRFVLDAVPARTR